MTSNVVWNQTAAWDSPNPAAGSTGGVSAIFPEPDWQNDSSANAVIQGGGRGVPDIAAIANNTIMTLTIGGIEYNASNASLGRFFINVAGTSIASPLTAGMVVDADHVMGQFGSGWLGFLDPTLYPLANAQYTPANSVVTPSTGYIATGAYNSTLPTLPFFDVTVGRNFADSALVGYDLVTGWGTMDAYNFTMYFVSYLPSNTPGDLASVLANFNLTGLQVTSTSPYYNASIQQNFFVANALGAPIYWVQNVIYINGSPGAWQMNFSGWVVFPYWGIYPSATIYEYNFPVTGQGLSTPLDFSIETTLQNTTIFDGQSVQFSFGIPDATPLTLPLPGGSGTSSATCGTTTRGRATSSRTTPSRTAPRAASRRSSDWSVDRAGGSERSRARPAGICSSCSSGSDPPTGFPARPRPTARRTTRRGRARPASAGPSRPRRTSPRGPRPTGPSVSRPAPPRKGS